MIKNNGLIHIEDMKEFNSDDLETLLHRILNYIKIVTNSDAGTIYLKDDDKLRFSIFQNNTFKYETIFKLQKPLKKLRFPISKDTETIAVESFVNSKIIAVDNIYGDSNFDFKSAKEFDKEFGYRTRSILTAPLIDKNIEEPIGVIQLINKQDKHTGELIPFTDEDKEFISLSSYLIVLSILSTKNSIQELEKLNMELEEKVIQRTKELQRTQDQLIEQTNRDPMTNLYNRRYFNNIVEEMFPILQRGEKNLCVMMVDIDDFKNINDKYGHAIGDKVINHLADIFRANLRKTDITIRFGGEEFLVLLTNTSVNDSIKIAEKLRKTIENITVEIEGKDDIKFTVSIGLAQTNQDDKNIEISINKADKLLYKAKTNGKNKVYY